MRSEINALRALQRKLARELASSLRLGNIPPDRIIPRLQGTLPQKGLIDAHELLCTLIPWVRKYPLDLVWAGED